MNKENKGFTMLELLATIIILSLLVTLGYISVRSILKRGDESYYQSQEDMLILAGREYFADHRSELPKKIGGTSSVTLETLINENYIDPIKDEDDNDCNFKESNVTSQKVTDKDYQYYGLLKCDNKYETDKDESSPTITFTPNKASSDDSITVKMNITDNVGVASYRYVITKDKEKYYDSEYQTYNKEVTINLTEIGLYEITGYAIDQNGNRATRESGQYSIYNGIDCSAVKFDSSVKEGTWTNKNITVDINVPDNTYRMDLSKITNEKEELLNSYIGSGKQSITLNTEGSNKIKVVLYDSNGNSCTATTDSYNIDKTKPDLSVVLKKKKNSTNLKDTSNINSLSNYTNNTWYSGYVVLRGACSDSESNCTVSYKVTGASTNTDNYVNGTTCNINASGTSTVVYKATDQAGNTVTKKYTIKLDRTRPTVSYNKSRGTYNTKSLEICATAKDNTGVSSVRMQVWSPSHPNGTLIKDNTAQVNKTSRKFCYTLSGYGTYTVYTKVTDYANNIQNKSPENTYNYYYQKYTLKSPKSAKVLNNNYYVCPEDREIPTKEQCKSGEYNTMYVDNVKVSNNTTVSFRVRVHMNNWSNTWEENQSRTLCIANTNNKCVKNLDTFSIASPGWLGTGETRTLGSYTVNVSSFAAGDYKIIIDGASQKFRFKNSSGMKNTFRVTG